MSKSELATSPSRALQAPNIDVLPVSLIVGCWLLMAFLVDARGDFPLNDDWVYAQAVKSVLDGGYYSFPSATSANVGPQVYWGALFCLPFGFSFTALRLSTLVLGLGGAIVFYSLVKEVRSSRATAVVCSSMLAVNPLYFSLSNTFMTDVPFLVASLAAMYLLLLGLRRDSLAYEAFGIGMALLAILIRQAGIVLIVGYVVATVVKQGWTGRTLGRGIALVALGLAVHFGYQLWLVKTGRVPFSSGHSNLHLLIANLFDLSPKVATLIAGGVYTGIFAAPLIVLLFFLPRSSSTAGASRSTRIILVALVPLLYAVFRHLGVQVPTLGNVLTRSGIGPLLLFDMEVLNVNRPPISIGVKTAWALVSLLSIGAALTAGRQLARPVLHFMTSVLRRRATPGCSEFSFFAAIALSYLAILVFIAGGKVAVFDRYFLPLLPLVALMICSSIEKPLTDVLPSGWLASAMLVVLFAAFSVAATHDFMAWSRARWSALNELMATGVPPERIDGGYEFNGWYLSHLQPVGEGWRWGRVGDEYVIAAGGLSGYTEVRRQTYSPWLFGTASDVLTLRKTSR